MPRGSTPSGGQRFGGTTREAKHSRLGQALDIGAPANRWKAQACLRAHSELALAVRGRSPAPITIDSDPESDRPN